MSNARQPIASDRRETDESLRAERTTTDEILEPDALQHRVEEALNRERAAAAEHLREAREEVDAHLERQAAVLPKISETLDALAGSLTEAAVSLTGVADTLKESVAPIGPAGHVPRTSETRPEEPVTSLTEAADDLAEVADEMANVAEPAAEADDSGTIEPAAPATVVEKLADIVGGIATVAADLDADRDITDEKLNKERDVTDRILDQHVAITAPAIADDFLEHRDLLDLERRTTDADLAKEREHTDDALDNALRLLHDEKDAHASARTHYATRNEFLAIVSHDLRGPLNAMTVAATLIANAVPDDERGSRIRGWAASIRHSTAIMNRLITDLLDFASFEDGRLKVAAKQHDMRELVTRAVELYEPLAAKRSVALDASMPDAPAIASYDFDRMLQVMSNLLQNAIKFTPAGGAIHVRLASDEGERVIAVSDTGIGIPKNEIPTIFERFKQVRRGGGGGLGLGLYISKWIIEAHNGRIWVDSEEGHGTTFYAAIPIDNV
jgi:signal transduction histidine kinase